MGFGLQFLSLGLSLSLSLSEWMVWIAIEGIEVGPVSNRGEGQKGM